MPKNDLAAMTAKLDQDGEAKEMSFHKELQQKLAKERQDEQETLRKEKEQLSKAHFDEVARLDAEQKVNPSPAKLQNQLESLLKFHERRKLKIVNA